MTFVERDKDGNISGAYARPQSGRAVARLAENHPDLVAFRQKQSAQGAAVAAMAAARQRAPEDITVLARQLEAEIPALRRTPEFAALLARLGP